MDRASRLFVGYRALGFTSNAVPLCVRYDEKRRENFVVTCVGRAFHTYNVSSVNATAVSVLFHYHGSLAYTVYSRESDNDNGK